MGSVAVTQKEFEDRYVNRILCGDCLEVMRGWPDGCVHCCVTSPPYWGLRDYGVDAQLGREKTPDEYVAKMVEVFREVRRVLRDDGTLWLNLGSSYTSGGWKTYGPIIAGTKQASHAEIKRTARADMPPGFKPKDMVPIPWMVALALQKDGWYLRCDIIWAKPNPMPESVMDRPTKAHEYLFLLSKKPRYFYDAEAVKEPMSDATYQRLSQKTFDQQTGGPKDTKTGNRSHRKALRNQREKLIRQEKWKDRFIGYEEWKQTNGGRNKRSVWTIPTEPFRATHFATFPLALVRPCIRAGCPKDGIVLDPFGGSGTVGQVAAEEGRNYVLIELNPEYIEIAQTHRLEAVETGVPVKEAKNGQMALFGSAGPGDEAIINHQ